jgi:integrase
MGPQKRPAPPGVESAENTAKKQRRPRGAGSLFQRGGVWWIAYYHRGQLIRESAKTNKESTAARLLRARLSTADRSDFVDPRAAERVMFSDLATAFINDYRLNRRRSLPDALRHVEKLRGTFGADRALDITADRIAAYADGRRTQDHAAAATVNRELAALRRMFVLAVKQQRLASRPPITLLREDNVREGFVDPAEFVQLLAALCARDAAVADVIEFAYLTCLRRGNAFGAVWPWFKLRISHGLVTEGVVRLPGSVTKNGRPLPLVLTGPLLALIQRRWTQRRHDCAFVFHRDGRPIRDFRTVWAAACEVVGLQGLLFHDLRRSAARNYRKAGVTEDVIMRIGGWKTRSVFSRYNVVDERDLAAAGERLAAFLTTAGTATPTVVPLTPPSVPPPAASS